MDRYLFPLLVLVLGLLATVAVDARQAAADVTSASPLSGSFSDDDGNVHELSIEAIAAEGITRGCNPPINDRYCPDATVTRGQMAAFLVRALGLADDGGGDLFVDDDGSVFESDIDKLGTAGATRGCNPPVNDRYCPDDLVKRDQMASFVARALALAIPQRDAVLAAKWSVDPPQPFLGQPFVVEAEVTNLGILPIASVYVQPLNGCVSTDPVDGPERLGDDGDALLEFGERWVYTVAFDRPDCEPARVSVPGASYGATDMDLHVEGEWDLGQDAPWPIAFGGRFLPSQPNAGDTVLWIVTVESLAPYEIGSVEVVYEAWTDVPLFPTTLMSGPTEIIGDGDSVFEPAEIWEFVGDATVTEDTSFFAAVDVWPTHLPGQGYSFTLDAELSVAP